MFIKLSQNFATLIYIIVLGLFAVYTYALVDPNLTLLNASLWENFRDGMVDLGYHQRQISAQIYALFIVLLFIFHLYFLKHFKKIKVLPLVILMAFIGVLSYPFLSHDFFSYIFDAKIITAYQQNPYVFKPSDFPDDPWLRFMHWTHRTYPYGPTFLVLSLIPSFLAFGKLLLNFLFFKALFVGLYLLAFHSLYKKNMLWGVFFLTNPLIIVEGIVNSHNDMIALSLGVIGLVYVFDKKYLWGRVLLALSGGVKYMTLPLLFIEREGKWRNKLIFGVIAALVAYISYKNGVQPWYFLAFMTFIPLYYEFVASLNILFAGLLLSYYPLIRFGQTNEYDINHKLMIIFVFAIINLVYLFFRRKEIKFLNK